MEKFTIKQALKVFGLGEGEYTAKEIKFMYRRLSMRYHPDRKDGNAELMKAINQAWEVLSAIGDISANDYFNDWESTESYADDAIIQKLKKAIEALQGFANPDIEVCGVWLYLHSDLRGNNYKEIREAIKTAGWRWSVKKSVWYFNPEPKKVKRARHRKDWAFDEIRSTYGSNKYHTDSNNKNYLSQQ